jgi:hypothetical protein
MESVRQTGSADADESSVAASAAVWEAEARAAARAAELARELALTLPAESVIRARMLRRADDWTTLAALRGQRSGPVRSASLRSA